MSWVVLSPHLDDAVLSVGATIHRLTQLGHHVDVVTVFAGDPTTTSPPNYWDAGRGTKTAAEALAQRRLEDSAAVQVIGAKAAWLPFDDIGYIALRDPSRIWAAIEPFLAGVDGVLLPGWPLQHPDHVFTTLLALDRLPADVPRFFYMELPYAVQPLTLLKSIGRRRSAAALLHTLGSALEWRPSAATDADHTVKSAALSCYHGELKALGRGATLARLHGRFVRREMIGLPADAPFPAYLLR